MKTIEELAEESGLMDAMRERSYPLKAQWEGDASPMHDIVCFASLVRAQALNEAVVACLHLLRLGRDDAGVAADAVRAIVAEGLK